MPLSPYLCRFAPYGDPHTLIPSGFAGSGSLKPLWDKAHSLHLTRLGKYEKMRVLRANKKKKAPVDKITKIVYNKGIANAH